MKLNLIKKPVILGLVAGIFLLGLYFLILTLANSFSHAIEQFSQMWYWILILVIGFGIQIGLYFYIRESFRLKQIKSPTAVVATSGGISTGSMLACCLHHLVDVLPIMGLTVMALFLIKYQVIFLVIGILSNLIGITLLLEIIQKNNLPEGFLKKFLFLNIAQVKKLIIGLSLVLVFVTFFLVNKPAAKTSDTLNLPSKTSDLAEISFEVTPVDFSFGNPVKFEIKIDTHSGSLDFDLTQISILEDDNGNKYKPLDWQGSSSGGHHRSGTLIFPKLENQSKLMQLIIEDTFQRIFEWDFD